MLGGWSPIGPGPISAPLPGFAPVLPCEEHLQQLLTVIPGGKGPVLIGSLSVRLAGPTRMGSAYTVDEGNSGSPGSCSPLFPLFLLWGRGSLIPSDSSGGGGLFPPGEPATEEGIWRRPNFRLQVNQVPSGSRIPARLVLGPYSSRLPLGEWGFP